jgi:hypothetical protein
LLACYTHVHMRLLPDAPMSAGCRTGLSTAWGSYFYFPCLILILSVFQGAPIETDLLACKFPHSPLLPTCSFLCMVPASWWFLAWLNVWPPPPSLTVGFYAHEEVPKLRPAHGSPWAANKIM